MGVVEYSVVAGLSVLDRKAPVAPSAGDPIRHFTTESPVGCSPIAGDA